MNNEDQLAEARQYWNEAAASFDDEPDHGLHDPQVLAAWTGLLRTWLPAHQTTVLDVGCGTGSLSVVLAELGHAVTGIDVSPAMLARAQAKAAARGHRIEFHVMDAAEPLFPPQSFDIAVCRHLLWMFPRPSKVLDCWAGLLKPGGRLILIEGHWSTGGGLHATELAAALPPSVRIVSVQHLNDQSAYWGRPVSDERYVIIADRHP